MKLKKKKPETETEEKKAFSLVDVMRDKEAQGYTFDGAFLAFTFKGDSAGTLTICDENPGTLFRLLEESKIQLEVQKQTRDLQIQSDIKNKTFSTKRGGASYIN